ncbi:MAG: hemerythrin domain-containing protein [Nocardioidaceae bacterium]
MGRGSADDLMDALKDHHARIEQMTAAVSAASGHDREVVFRRLRRFLAAHEAAEQVFIHASASRLLADPDIADQRLTEEDDTGRIIASLEAVDVDSAEFDRILAELRTSVRRHARAEELQELPEVIGSNGPADIERMRQALDHVDLVVSRRHGPLGEDDQSFATMLEAARAEFRALRDELSG